MRDLVDQLADLQDQDWSSVVPLPPELGRNAALLARRRVRRRRLAVSVPLVAVVLVSAGGVIAAQHHDGDQLRAANPASADPNRAEPYFHVQYTSDTYQRASTAGPLTHSRYTVDSWVGNDRASWTQTGGDAQVMEPAFADHTFSGDASTSGNNANGSAPSSVPAPRPDAILSWADMWSLPTTAPALAAYFTAHKLPAGGASSSGDGEWLQQLLLEPGPHDLKQAAVQLLSAQPDTVTTRGTDSEGRDAIILTRALPADGGTERLYVDPVSDQESEYSVTSAGPTAVNQQLPPAGTIWRHEVINSIGYTESHSAPAPQPVPAATPSAPPASYVAPPRPRVTFQGITLAVPAGWTVTTRQGCRTAARTIVINDGGVVASCPAGVPLPSPVVDLQRLYGPQKTTGWSGSRTVLDGQPAWRDGTGNPTLTLPWLNARVVITGSATDAAAVLASIDFQVADSLKIPDTAANVALSTFRPDAVGAAKGLDRTVTDPNDIRRLLADLRAEPLITDPRAACASDENLDEAVLTVDARTFLVRFGTCDQTTSGTGVAAQSSAALRADIVRLLPDGGLR